MPTLYHHGYNVPRRQRDVVLRLVLIVDGFYAIQLAGYTFFMKLK